MRPLIGGMPGVVIELKAADKETEDLDALARVSHTPPLIHRIPAAPLVILKMKSGNEKRWMCGG